VSAEDHRDRDDALIRLYGTAEPLPEERPLRAGPLTAVFAGGALRSIKVRGVEVIRGLSFLVRDRRWGTPTPVLSNVRVEEEAQRSFRVRFDALTASEGIALRWEGTIEASPAAGLAFRVRGVPDADLATCRTGFVVLHPLERVAGCPAEIEHGDGGVEAAAFPDAIDPLQPFLDVRAMTHEPIPGLRATCRMEGDAPWETEDHRNWLDASFKTYFRPLAMPWPYVLEAGEPIEQAVTLTFEPSLEGLEPADEGGPVTVSVGDRAGAAMPGIGLACSPDDLAASEAALPHLEGLSARWIAFRVAVDTPDLPGTLRRYARLATALRAEPRLEIVLPGVERPAVELDLVAAAASSAGLVPESVAVSPAVDLKSYPPSVDRPPGPPLREIVEAAREAFPGVPIGGGMFSFFTEFNRRRPPLGLLDFAQHATSATVHAADDRSVMETLESLPHVFRSAAAVLGGTPYRVGPAQIGMAQNPYGASTAPNPDRTRVAMASDDPRAGALFGAAWAAGYLCRAAAAGGLVEGVTVAAPGGPFGLADATGGRRPAFHVLRSFAAAAGAPTLACASSDPRRVLACACAARGRTFAWLANLTAEPQQVALSGLRPTRTLLFDANGPEPREADAGVLPPYAVAFVEG
jgi:hypothetical protein